MIRCLRVQTPLIDGSLQRELTFFVGSESGKEFYDGTACLSYRAQAHRFGSIKVRKATVLYFALEDDYPTFCGEAIVSDVRCKGDRQSVFSQRNVKTVNGGLERRTTG